MPLSPSPCVDIQLAAMNRAKDSLRRQRHRRQARQHLGQRDQRVDRVLRIALGRFQADRLIHGEVSGSCAAQCREMCAGAEPLPEIVGQRPHVKAGRAVDKQRDAVRLDADDLDAVSRDAGGGG